MIKPVPGKPVKYKRQVTAAGVWRSHLSLDGRRFREFQSHFHVGSRPMVSIAGGVNPETGQPAVARGIVAIGQRARGGLAIGQFASGYVAIGQFAVGRVAAIGQFAVAPLCVGQFALGVAAIGQIGFAGWGIFQTAVTTYGGIGQWLANLSDYLPL